MITVEDADALARRAHGSDRARSGSLFIDHVRRVAALVADDADPYAVPAALLHDAVEKGSMDWADLRDAGADDRLIALIDALTERPREPPLDYLVRCAADPLAWRIKRADLVDKLDPVATSTLSDRRRRVIEVRAQTRLDQLDQLASGDP